MQGAITKSIAGEDAEALGLRALAWTLGDERRAARLLDTTGLTPDDLRARVGEPAVLGAVLGYLEAYEPDLIACAEALDGEARGAGRGARERSHEAAADHRLRRGAAAHGAAFRRVAGRESRHRFFAPRRRFRIGDEAARRVGADPRGDVGLSRRLLPRRDAPPDAGAARAAKRSAGSPRQPISSC